MFFVKKRVSDQPISHCFVLARSGPFDDYGIVNPRVFVHGASWGALGTKGSVRAHAAVGVVNVALLVHSRPVCVGDGNGAAVKCGGRPQPR